MKGIKFIKELNKTFGLTLKGHESRDNYSKFVVYTDDDLKNTIWVRYTHLSGWIWNLEKSKRISFRFKSSEKYKIKQLIHDALSYSK